MNHNGLCPSAGGPGSTPSGPAFLPGLVQPSADPLPQDYLAPKDRHKGHPTRRAQIATLRAAEMSIEEIARTLGRHSTEIARYLKREDVQSMIDDYRRMIRAQALAHCQQIQRRGWELVGQTLDDGDPKGFDAATRGMANIERIAQSASGELKPQATVQIANIVGTVPDELAQVIQAWKNADSARTLARE